MSSGLTSYEGWKSMETLAKVLIVIASLFIVIGIVYVLL